MHREQRTQEGVGRRIGCQQMEADPVVLAGVQVPLVAHEIRMDRLPSATDEATATNETVPMSQQKA